MRLLHVTIPPGRRADIIAVLDERELPYTLSEDAGDREVDGLVTTPVLNDEVEAVLEELRSAGVTDDHYVAVLEVSALVNGLEEELIEDDETDEEITTRISRDELQTRAEELLASRTSYGVMTAVSAIVASAGILMDSAAVVVGSMVIAPLIGPSLAASVGTVLDDPELFRSGLKLQITGVVLAILAATAFAGLVNVVHLVPPDIVLTDIGQVTERLNPDFLALAIALGAGIAGAVSLATGVSAALVGVMIAVALIPPAAVIGIGIAWGRPTVVLGSSILLVINLLAINLSALGVLWYMGFRPSSWFETARARDRLVRQAVILVVAILFVSLFLGGATYGSYQASMQEDRVMAGIDDVLADSAHDHIEVSEVTIERDDRPLLAVPERVVITLTRPVGTAAPSVADAFAAAISERLDRAVAVEVIHLEREQSA